MFNTFGFKKNYERIENYLSEDETVLYIRNGNVKIDNSGELKESGFSIKDKTPVILAITDKRVLIYFRVLFDEKLEQIPIKEIRTFDFKRNGLTSSVFRITSLTKSVDLDLTCNADEVKLLNDTLLTLIK
nr:PH domain-containing protein [Tissierella simiarum]